MLGCKAFTKNKKIIKYLRDQLHFPVPWEEGLGKEAFLIYLVLVLRRSVEMGKDKSNSVNLKIIARFSLIGSVSFHSAGFDQIIL